MFLGLDLRIVANNLPLLLNGAVVTVQVSILAILFGLVLGAFFGLFSVSHSPSLRAISWGYVQFFRGTPLLVQVLWIYFGLGGLGLDVPAFWAGVIALGLNSGGYQAEIVRAGIESIDRGQTDAASAIGLSRIKTLLLILVPQAVRRVIPPLTNELISLVKSSSLLAAISLFELTHSGQAIIARTFAPFEIYAAVAMMYLLIVAVLSRFSTFLEQRVFINY
jgi:His/Glu/Gln/Arg/opine family amino acid ABC transporter permease subunit